MASKENINIQPNFIYIFKLIVYLRKRPGRFPFINERAKRLSIRQGVG